MRILHLIQSIILIAFFFSCKNEQKQLTEHEHTNDLVTETSPYLLQHAHNPVDWKAWGNDIFETAKKENKLVLISIGYSSCHWCHVMEAETFEDEEVAKFMNSNFINIKVDREERPDVDQVYMTALQLLSGGQGGWPLNVITLPNGKPLYAGTYHTKEQWTKVLNNVNTKFIANPEEANTYADKLADGIAEMNFIQKVENSEILTKTTLKNSVTYWKPNWDMQWGGNKGEQKFMLPVNLNFLLDYAEITKDTLAKKMVKRTLDKMAMGGIYDHIGGGTYRYSTDMFWKVPHFEKMLYDNAQFISLYAKAYTVFKEVRYKDVVTKTLAFLEREMKNVEGGYYAALDADSEGEEGKFYIWKKEELEAILKADFSMFQEFYGINSNTAWENESYIIHETQSRKTFAKNKGLSKSELDDHISKWQKTLLKARSLRIRPRKDDKIITSWNALLVSAFVDAYKAFGNRAYLDRALHTFNFISKEREKNVGLVHSYKKGGTPVKGFLEDYAFLENAALDIYQVTLNTSYLDIALDLNAKVQKDFSDSESGLFVYNSNEELISKILKTDDGVLPSPNAVMAHNLFQLGHLMYDVEFLKKAKDMLSSIAPLIQENAYSYSKWNSLLLQTTYPYYEIAAVGKDAKTFVADLNRHYLPNSLIVGSLVKSDLPLFKSRYDDEETFIYICKQTTCKLPVNSVKDALSQFNTFEHSPF